MRTFPYALAPVSRARSYIERAILFALAATSIWSLLVEFYGIASMRAFVLWAFLPATVVVLVWAAWDRARGSGYVWRVVWVGALAGFLAACAYDVFRVPFVFAREMRIDSIVPVLPLFKVFPEFGHSIAFGPVASHEIKIFFPRTHVIGWAYHFSNGMTFGIMYLALIGDAARRSWLWAVAFAVVLELGMLFTPYPRAFGINVTPTFVAVTLTAHVVFGIALGLCARWLWNRAGRSSH